MAIQLGPILYAGESDQAIWRFSVQLAIDNPVGAAPPFSIEVHDAGVVVSAAQLVADFSDINGWTVWRWQVEVRRGAAERKLRYEVCDSSGATIKLVENVAVPQRNGLPRIALFSCNGSEEGGGSRRLDDPAALWRVLRERHCCGMDHPESDDPTGFHLLIGSGDQVYADGIEVLANKENGLDQMSARELRRLGPSAGRRSKALRQYLELYRRVWGQEEVASVMESVPGVYTWDDHDIMDGWGSHRDTIQDNVAYQEVYRAARKAFVVFQLGGDPTEAVLAPLVCRANPPDAGGSAHFLQSLSFREADRWLDILLLDLRSDRTQDQVLSEGQWSDLKAWLRQYASEAAQASQVLHRHLLIVSSIPVVYLRFRLANFVLRNLVPGAQALEDDLLDHWEHPRHQGERDRLIMTLLGVRQKAGAQVTLLSGDVHVAARGRVVSTDASHLRTTASHPHLEKSETQAVIQQVVSSGIVHSAPGRLEHAGIDVVGTEGPAEVSNGVFTEMVDIDTQRGRLRARNFATVAFDNPQSSVDLGRMWVEWVVEDGFQRRQLVVES